MTILDSGPGTSPDVPQSWRVVPLLAVASETVTPNTGMKDSNLLSLSYGKIVRKDIDTTNGLLPASFETYQIVEPGDIVLRLTDLQNDKRSLRTGRVTERGIITSAYVAIRPGGSVDSRFLHYTLHSLDLRKVFYSLGGGLRQSITFEELRRLPVAVPHVDEQRQIADYLDAETTRIDALIEKKQRLQKLALTRFDRWRDSRLGCTVTDGLNRTGTARWIPVRYFASVHGGLTLGKQYDEVTHEFPYLRVANVQDGVLELGDVATIAVPERVARRHRLLPGDLLMLEGNGNPANLGRSALWDGPIDDCLHQNHVHVVRAQTAIVSPSYLAWLMRTEWARWIFTGAGDSVSISTLSQAQIASLRLPILPRVQQDEIVATINVRGDAVRAMAELQAREIRLLTERRQALITAAVTGRFEVPGVAA